MNQHLLNSDGEVVLAVAGGATLRSGVYEHGSTSRTCGEYVRLVDAAGEEVAYWDHAEWAADPISVMGAIINAAASAQ